MYKPCVSRSEKGRLLGRILKGAWQPGRATPAITGQELEAITPLLLRSGCGALAWWRIRDSALGQVGPAGQLRNAYRLHRLQVALKEKQLLDAFRYLRARGVEPLLAKGWAVGRLYPERGLRPYGDLDLGVRPPQYRMALAALRDPAAPPCAVELHRVFRELEDRPGEALFERSRSMALGETRVRILGAEDHLRLLSLHALHHGVFRPLWLCDLAVCLEALPGDFDWQLCLRGDAWRSEGVRCALLLAGRLLGASLEQVPEGCRRQPVPSWMESAVLRQWGKLEHYMRGPGAGEYLLHPGGALKALRLRWPNPVRATYTTGAPFNEWPRLPFQAAEYVIRLLRFLRRLPAAVRNARRASRLS